MKSNSIIESTFGNRLRMRVSGILIERGEVLLIGHKMYGQELFWSAPGGGLHFGETAEECLVREFQEETNMKIQVKKFLFVHEFLDPPLHAIELFFEVVKKNNRKPQLGRDPELRKKDQILADLRFFSTDAMKNLPEAQKHGIFKNCKDVIELLELKGYYRS